MKERKFVRLCESKLTIQLPYKILNAFDMTLEEFF